MQYFLSVAFILFLSIPCNSAIAETYDLQSIKRDVVNFNISCTNDNCQYQDEDSLLSRNCHCGMHCTQLGTCCLDSPYVNVPQPKLKPVCRYVYGSGYYFVVDRCPTSDSVWASLCNDETGEDDDVQNLVPVTSLSTSITYKNYYCFMCNEPIDEFLYWTLQIESKSALNSTFSEDKMEELVGHISFIYNKENDTLRAFYDNETGYIDVRSFIEAPSEIMNITHVCEEDVISDCSDDWSDEEVRRKCQAYMGLKTVEALGGPIIMYKNIHCALCNNRSLKDIRCREISYDYEYGVGNRGAFGSRYGGGNFSRPGSHFHRFSFTYLLDINKSDGEFVGKIQKCYEDKLWDPYAKKCRKVSCAVPGLKIKNGKCTHD